MVQLSNRNNFNRTFILTPITQLFSNYLWNDNLKFFVTSCIINSNYSNIHPFVQFSERYGRILSYLFLSKYSFNAHRNWAPLNPHFYFIGKSAG